VLLLRRGHRVSLAKLRRILHGIAGVIDGQFFTPTDLETPRGRLQVSAVPPARRQRQFDRVAPPYEFALTAARRGPARAGALLGRYPVNWFNVDDFWDARLASSPAPQSAPLRDDMHPVDAGTRSGSRSVAH
jgi:hypothetical protein